MPLAPLGIPNLAGPQVGPAGVGPTQPMPYPVQHNAQSAPPNTGVDIAAGISDFLTNYQRGRQAAQATIKQDFMQDVQLMMLGIPVDHTKMAKKAKLAGLDLDFEGNNAAT